MSSELESPIRRVEVTRYITPLREGGSLPAITEADDGFLYVLKFRGAGQGVKALIAELIGSEIARLIGLRVPELVFAELDEFFGRSEPDHEIQDLLKASRGLNLASHFLSGALTFDPAYKDADADTASKTVWLDAYLMNVDRTVRNTNILVWNRELWLIDLGAALYFHHAWEGWEDTATKPFTAIKDHVLLKKATRLQEANHEIKATLTAAKIEQIVGLIPDEWLTGPEFHQEDRDPQRVREVYKAFLIKRLESSDLFLNEAIHAHQSTI